MTALPSLGLARVTVATPHRRIDVALPEGVPVGELLPHLLRHAGEGVADDGEQHGGWTLRRATGALLQPGLNLAAQGVRDGEILHVVPRRTEWPELAYDDVVEVIAGGSRRTGRSWGNLATRRCGLAVSSAILALGLLGVLASGPPWSWPGLLALGFAVVTSVAGILLSRAVADAVAGSVVAATGLGYAALAGLLIAAPDAALGRLGAPHLLLGATTLLVFGIVGYVGVAGLARLFVAGIGIAALGALAALLSYASMSPTGAAAVALTVAICLLPGYPAISVWLGRLPVPALPERPEEMLAERPMPSRSAVFAAVHRSHELLTGFLLAAAIVSVVAFVLLPRSGSVPAVALTGVGSVALLLRARLFPIPWQRIPLLASGVFGLTLLAVRATEALPGSLRLVLALGGAGTTAALVLAAGLVYSVRPPSPYIRRLADFVDVLAIMLLVPLAAGVVGLYSGLQGMFASVA